MGNNVTIEEKAITAPPVSCTVRDRAVIRAWLEKRVGSGYLVAATGRLDTGGKYLPCYGPMPCGYVDYDACIDGVPGAVYGSHLRASDGKTWVWSADIDDKGLTELQVKAILITFAATGVPAIYWRRRPGRGHLEVYLSEPRDPRDIDAFLLAIAPDLATLNERYPIHTNALSWPLWYQLGRVVHGCAGYYAETAAPYRIHRLVMDRDVLTLHELVLLIETSVTPSALIPICAPVPKVEPKTAVSAHLPKRHEPGASGVVTFQPGELAAWFNARHSLEEIHPLASKDKALATWRGDKHPTVTYYPGGTWCDWGDNRKTGDALDLYILVHGLDKTAFQAELGREYRAELIGRSAHLSAESDRPEPIKPVETSERGAREQGGVIAFPSPVPTELFSREERLRRYAM